MVGMVHIADERPGMISFKLIGFLESLTPLMGEAIRKFNTEEELQHNHAIQSLMNSLLHISFEDIHLDEILDRSLSLIMDVSWMETVSGGASSWWRILPMPWSSRQRRALQTQPTEPVRRPCGASDTARRLLERNTCRRVTLLIRGMPGERASVPNTAFPFFRRRGYSGC